MAWSQTGRFVVKTLNSSSGHHVTGVTLLGSTDTVNFTVEADGLHLGPVTKPTSVDNAFVFRLHMNGSAVGFVAWDLPDDRTPMVVPGSVCHLRWQSGGHADDHVAIDMWDGTTWVAVDIGLPNTGSFAWQVPMELPRGVPTLRISAVKEPWVQHVAAFPRRR